MKSAQSILDKLAVCLSMICVIHCIGLPILLILLPGLSMIPAVEAANCCPHGDETVAFFSMANFHMLMVLTVVPTSAYALITGYVQHRRFPVVIIGLLGITILSVGAILGVKVLGADAEKALTVAGSTAVACAHVWNFSLCRKCTGCTTAKCASE